MKQAAILTLLICGAFLINHPMPWDLYRLLFRIEEVRAPLKTLECVGSQQGILTLHHLGPGTYEIRFTGRCVGLEDGSSKSLKVLLGYRGNVFEVYSTGLVHGDRFSGRFISVPQSLLDSHFGHEHLEFRWESDPDVYGLKLEIWRVSI